MEIVIFLESRGETNLEVYSNHMVQYSIWGLDREHKGYVVQNVCWKDSWCLHLTDVCTDHQHTQYVMLF